ncbi:hypothetical protein [Streptomyces acidicola]|uniref:Uncharacterized protein n=1 Tax=Streptomyces acidicola TaxID=2596892 RepID=A0A5N8WJY0_9ACTN|nr:hypothetical protein [Streptomyces acidicola]MPY47146.1 hypothetical protein [Streptomyces acidicola]MPY47285.1 hypothetical protein [Streptomyces acidicola]
MPSLSSLADNFNDGVIGPNWGNSYGGVTETGGKARVPCGTGFAGYQTAYSWTLAGASFFVKVVTVPTAGAATECYCGVLVNSGIDGTRIGFTINAVANLLRCKNDTGYFDPDVVEIPYDPVAHAFLRLREDGTNVYWDTSPDGSTWTNRRTLASPAWIATTIDACALDMSAHRDAGTVDNAEYDFFNTLSDGAVYNASATLTGESVLTAAVSYTAVAAAELTADGSLTAAPTLVAEASAALTGQSELVADASGSGEFPEGVVGLAAGEHDLHLEQGATFYQTYTCGVGDSPMLWDGWSARAQIRSQAAESADLLLDLTPYLTIAGNKITLQVPASVTENLTRNGRWDLEMVKGAWVVRLLNGAAIVSPEVTR